MQLSPVSTPWSPQLSQQMPTSINLFLPQAERDLEEAPDLASSGDDYATRFSGPVGDFFLDVQSQALLSLARPWAGGSALDVGGGHGQNVLPLLGEGFRVTVLGSHAESWGRAHRKFGETVDFATGSIIQPPFGEESFDIVTSFRMLAHVSGWREMIAGLCSVARHAVIVDFPVASSLKYVGRPVYFLKKTVEGNTRPFQLFSLPEVKEVFARHGFGLTTPIRQFGLPMALHRTLGSAEMSRRAEGWLRAAGMTDRFGSPVVLLATRKPVEAAQGTGIDARPAARADSGGARVETDEPRLEPDHPRWQNGKQSDPMRPPSPRRLRPRPTRPNRAL